ncbi:MAG: hypothetical protein ABFQ89_05950 [Chloroflexota bacterium]
MVRKVIIDFDGTLTAEENQAAELQRRSLNTLSQMMSVPLAELEQAYDETRKNLLSQPHRYWWEVNGLIASYCDEGAFILNTTTMQNMLRDNKGYHHKIGNVFDDPEYDPVIDCINYLFHHHTAEIPPEFRESTSATLTNLIRDERFLPLILTNSLGNKVTRQLSQLDLEREIHVLGDTRQYDMDPEWQGPLPIYADEPVKKWIADELHSIDLRRKVYYQALLEAQSDGSTLAVVADTLSLPGALPMQMGIPFFLLETSYTPDWSIMAVNNHPFGYMLKDLTQLPAKLNRLP